MPFIIVHYRGRWFKSFEGFIAFLYINLNCDLHNFRQKKFKDFEYCLNPLVPNLLLKIFEFLTQHEIIPWHFNVEAMTADNTRLDLYRLQQ